LQLGCEYAIFLPANIYTSVLNRKYLEMLVIIDAQSVQALHAVSAIQNWLFSGVEVRLGERNMAIVEESQRVRLRLLVYRGAAQAKDGLTGGLKLTGIGGFFSLGSEHTI
jgi:hypothetical protein